MRDLFIRLLLLSFLFGAMAPFLGAMAPARAAEPFLDGSPGNCFLCDFIGRRLMKAQREGCSEPLAHAADAKREARGESRPATN
jgi:hypothetical protein